MANQDGESTNYWQNLSKEDLAKGMEAMRKQEFELFKKFIPSAEKDKNK